MMSTRTDQKLPASSVATVGPVFIASSTWAGSRTGYYFGTDERGTGYYLDKHQLQQKQQQQQEGQKESSNNDGSGRKRGVQFAEEKNEMRLLREAEEQASDSYVVDLTPKGIQSAANALEKIWKKNSMARARYADQPEQYMDSEMQLYDQLSALQAIGADSKLYRHVETSNLLSVLIQLLGHDNGDIAASVVALFYQLIDPSLVDEDPDCLPVMGKLASIILEEAWEAIVTNLYRFQDEDDDSQDPNLKGIDNTLSLMENILEIDGLLAPVGVLLDQSFSAAAYMARESYMSSWLFFQLESEATEEQNEEELKGRCLELIAFLAQNVDVFEVQSDWNALPRVRGEKNGKEPPTKKKKEHSTIEGIDLLLQAIGKFRKRQPANDQQTEMLENACLALSSCITFSIANLKHFLDLEGVPLVTYCEKNNVHSGYSALRLLDFSGEGEVRKKAAEEIVTSGLLKYIFPLFLGTRIPKPARPLKSVKVKRAWLNDIKDRVVRILYGLSLHLDANSPEDGMERFLAKFVEDNLKNCDRLVELFLEYDEKSRKAEYNFFRSDVDEAIEDDEEQLTLAAFDSKLKNGGDMCHRLAAVTAFICAHSKRCHERVISQLKLQQTGMSLIRESLKEFSTSLRPGKQQEHIKMLLKQI